MEDPQYCRSSKAPAQHSTGISNLGYELLTIDYYLYLMVPSSSYIYECSEYVSLYSKGPFSPFDWVRSFYMTSIRHLFLGGPEKSLQDRAIDHSAFHRATCIPEESKKAKGQ